MVDVFVIEPNYKVFTKPEYYITLCVPLFVGLYFIDNMVVQNKNMPSAYPVFVHVALLVLVCFIYEHQIVRPFGKLLLSRREMHKMQLQYVEHAKRALHSRNSRGREDQS